MLLTGGTFIEVASRFLLGAALRFLVADAGKEASLSWLLILHAHPKFVFHLLPQALWIQVLYLLFYERNVLPA